MKQKAEKKKKETIIDVNGVLLIIKRETGAKPPIMEFAKEHEITASTIQNWDVKAPKAVAFIKNLLDKYPFLTFNDLVKNV